MLQKLIVQNFILIDSLELDFSKGLTTITGETGAGKSILLGALKLILGKRADVKSIKNEEKKCLVETHFNIESLDLESFFTEHDLDYFPTETIIRREISSSGKSRAFVNDTPVNLKTLELLSKNLIDIHSQFDHTELKSSDYQIKLLDRISGNSESVLEYQKLYKSFLEKTSKLQTLESEVLSKQKDKDYNDFILKELQEADIKVDELQELENLHKGLSSAQSTLENLNLTSEKLENEDFGILSSLSECVQNLEKTAELSEEFTSIYQRIHSCKIELDDLSSEIENLKLNTELNPEKLFETEQRLDLLNKLTSKHGVSTTEELLSILEELEQKNFLLENGSQEIESLKKEIEDIRADLTKKASTISSKRKKGSKRAEKELTEAIARLGLDKAKILFEFEPTDLSIHGMDKVSWLFSANEGQKPGELSKTASGGELSRVTLAIKKLLSSSQNLPTLILDEIDTGVSGKIAGQMALMMEEMSKAMQLITITHLPQIAAGGNQQLKVFKQNSKGKTFTQVKELSTDQRIDEIAEMLSSENITESARNQAQLLLQK